MFRSLLLVHLLASTLFFRPSSAEAGASSSSTVNATDYIRTSCNSTQYPELCYTSLVSYAESVQQNPARLARVAIGVSLSRANRLAIYIRNLTSRGDYGDDPRAAAALHDCSSVFGDAVDQMRESLDQMRRLKGAGEELEFEMSNVQTWMSAALTNEETCTDGFEDVADGPMKADVCVRVVKVKEITSNALALVNSFVANSKVMVP
ncbi:plant invertase/pectin methylesterase inhibitor superfamily protein [Dorcoceras hygrometricum]|uniref:Plant invertase/pectin methylesterase inhibitor superfamily protein n=1 Tax=Dorcoceras hygrometricum TaxID=472368 RepID=A0A2Z7ACQ8_9LAMI|nr:plant invertase/pectin methylesterase inhibitor superfamily protein [Dorcoceras hygrometricum]